MDIVQCTAAGFLLFKRVLEQVKKNGFLTVDEKIQIFRTMQYLAGMVLDQTSQCRELPRELQVPRIENSYLE